MTKETKTGMAGGPAPGELGQDQLGTRPMTIKINGHIITERTRTMKNKNRRTMARRTRVVRPGTQATRARRIHTKWIRKQTTRATIKIRAKTS